MYTEPTSDPLFEKVYTSYIREAVKMLSGSNQGLQRFTVLFCPQAAPFAWNVFPLMLFRLAKLFIL